MLLRANVGVCSICGLLVVVVGGGCCCCWLWLLLGFHPIVFVVVVVVAVVIVVVVVAVVIVILIVVTHVVPDRCSGASHEVALVGKVLVQCRNPKHLIFDLWFAARKMLKNRQCCCRKGKGKPAETSRHRVSNGSNIPMRGVTHTDNGLYNRPLR